MVQGRAENQWPGRSPTLTSQVAGLCMPEAGGQLLQGLRQRGHHVPEQPLLLLRAGPAGPAGQCLHRTLAPVEELKRARRPREAETLLGQDRLAPTGHRANPPEAAVCAAR